MSLTFSARIAHAASDADTTALPFAKPKFGIVSISGMAWLNKIAPALAYWKGYETDRLTAPGTDRPGAFSSSNDAEAHAAEMANTTDNSPGRLSLPYDSLGFPEAVYLDGGKKVSYCSGVLVDPSWVLTSAHCLESWQPRTQLTVSLGQTLINQYAVAGKNWRGIVDQVDIPEAYRQQLKNRKRNTVETARFDIALAHIAPPLVVERRITLKDSDPLPATFKATFASFGSNRDTHMDGATASLDVGWSDVRVESGMITWGPIDTTRVGTTSSGICPADSGSAVYLTTKIREGEAIAMPQVGAIGAANEYRHVVGIASRFVPIASSKQYDVRSNVCAPNTLAYATLLTDQQRKWICARSLAACQ